MGTSKLGLWSGVGLVVADMVGAGVLTTSGFMALELSAPLILLDWIAGGLVALCGALAYAALARRIPKSGGEYRYLSTLVHPAVGYLAGWTSLLVGFSVPVAIAALAAGAFAQTIVSDIDPKLVAGLIILFITGLHAANLRASKWTQNALAAVKAVLLVGFIGTGLIAGSNTLPPAPPEAVSHDGFPLAAFFTSLIFITFCYTGWNAATYAAEEFEDPRRNVPRAMIIGCTSVTVIYALVNWVFVTNLSRADMAGWIAGDTDRITLAHLVMLQLIGSAGAKVMSVVVIIALASAISAMTLIGPHVYAEMAKDRFLPPTLAGRDGQPPVGSVLLQSSLAMSLVVLSGFRELLNNVSSILAIVSAVTVLSIFRMLRDDGQERPGAPAIVGALVYAAMSAWMVYYAMGASRRVDVWGVGVPTLALWMAGIVGISMLGYVVTRALHPRVEPTASELVEPIEEATELDPPAELAPLQQSHGS